MKQFGSWDIYYSIVFVTDLNYLCLFKDYFMAKFISSLLTVQCLTWIYILGFTEKREEEDFEEKKAIKKRIKELKFLDSKTVLEPL